VPIYEYRPLAEACDHCRGRFEAWQKMSEAPLDRCPECGHACERVISAPNVQSGSGHVLKDSHFSQRGFTQYRKVDKGKYEKTAGPGPDKISSD
jgi:putative FmdB family regulatory protein